MKTNLVEESILEIFRENGNQTMKSAELFEEVKKQHDITRNSFNNTTSRMTRTYKLYRISPGEFQAILSNF